MIVSVDYFPVAMFFWYFRYSLCFYFFFLSVLANKRVHNTRTNRLDYGGNPDVDRDPGFFKMNFTTAVLAMVKAPRRGFDNSRKIRWLADLRQLNTALADAFIEMNRSAPCLSKRILYNQ